MICSGLCCGVRVLLGFRGCFLEGCKIVFFLDIVGVARGVVGQADACPYVVRIGLWVVWGVGRLLSALTFMGLGRLQGLVHRPIIRMEEGMALELIILF